MERIAILHYTGLPAIGGIESLIAAQVEALAALGHAVRLVVAEGEAPAGAELVRLPGLHPADGRIAPASAALRGSLPGTDHPLVLQLVDEVRPALEGCGQCWVHNALTVYLNPFLTVALSILLREQPNICWVAWCEDLTAMSRYWPGPEGEQSRQVALHPGVSYVTVSYSRRHQLAQLLSITPEDIRVITPPLDPDAWLAPGAETRAIVEKLELCQAEPLILVPAKLLPHKNLDLAVRLAGPLRSLTAWPRIVLTAAPSTHQPAASDEVRGTLYRLMRELGAEETLHLLPDVLGSVLGSQTVRDLMLLADLVFLPSTEEGYGMPLREAAALRTPVLCSDIPPFREAGAGAASYFSLDAPPEEIAARAAAIARLPANQERRESIRSAARFRSELQALVDGAGGPA